MKFAQNIDQANKVGSVADKSDSKQLETVLKLKHDQLSRPTAMSYKMKTGTVFIFFDHQLITIN